MERMFTHHDGETCLSFETLSVDPSERGSVTIFNCHFSKGIGEGAAVPKYEDMSEEGWRSWGYEWHQRPCTSHK